MNAQMQPLPGAEPMPQKPAKPRMTPKRLNALMLEQQRAAFNEGKEAGVQEGIYIAERDKHWWAMFQFGAGVLMGVVVVYPSLRWCWHAFRAFVAAHVH